MRLVAVRLIELVKRYPSLVDGVFIIIAWVGAKLCMDYLHALGVVAFEIPQLVSLGLIVVIFVIALIRARMEGPVEIVDRLSEEAKEVLGGQTQTIEQDLTR